MTETDNAPETVTMDQMLATGATYRQLDYWTQQGHLKPKQKAQRSGYDRTWPAVERDVARVMVRLIKAGIKLAAAATSAREAVESGATRIDLGAGVVISLEDPE